MEQKKERILIRLVGFILVFVLLGVGNNYVKTLLGTGIGLYYPYFALELQFIVFGAAGAVFGLEVLLAQKKRSGRWQMNWPRFLTLGIPGFFLGLFLILTNLYPAVPLFASVAKISLFVNLMQMLFGYAFVTSFYKPEENGVRYWG